jgi:hypothetical protein
MVWLLPSHSKLARYTLQRVAWIGPNVRALDEALLRARVPRAQGPTRLPFSSLIGDRPRRPQPAETVQPECGQILVTVPTESGGKILHAPRSISASCCLEAHPTNSANARKVSVGSTCVMMRSRTFSVHPLGLVNRKDSLSLDGFEGSGGDFPERHKPYLHDANTIVTSQQK